MAAPPKIYDESSKIGDTYFVTIDLGAQANTSPISAVFVPKGYNVGEEADMVLWLMGHHDNPDYPPSLTIDQYLSIYPHFKFRDFVNDSRKNVILAAPSLGARSEAGNLSGRGGLAGYIDQVLAVLQVYGPFKSLPRLGQLVIACHSGGGVPMQQIATTAQDYTPNLRQCWGFDCLYNGGDDSSWTTWAKGHAYKQLKVRYGDGGTKDQSLSLKRMASNLGNVNVDGNVATSHNKVPVTYWYDFLSKAYFFDDKL